MNSMDENQSLGIDQTNTTAQEKFEQDLPKQSPLDFCKYVSLKAITIGLTLLIILSIITLLIVTQSVAGKLGYCYKESADRVIKALDNSQLTSEQKCLLVTDDASFAKECEDNLSSKYVVGTVPLTKFLGKIIFGFDADEQSLEFINNYCSNDILQNPVTPPLLDASTIFEAIDKGIPAKCEVLIKETNVKFTIYTKNSNLYYEAISGDDPDKKNYLIIDSSTYWSWDSNRNEGGKTTISPLGQEREGLIQISLWEMAEDKELYKNSCQENVEISDSLFIPPLDITFIDQLERARNKYVNEVAPGFYNTTYQNFYKQLVYGNKPIISTSAQEAYKLAETKSIICLRDKNGSPTSYGTSYFKGGKFRFEGGNVGLNTEKDAIGIYDKDVLWVWGAAGTKGSKLEPSNSMPADEFRSMILEGLDKDASLCYEYSFVDELFEVPSGMSFETL